MSKYAKSRNAASLIVSGALHVAFALTLLSIPEEEKVRYDIVDMTVFTPPAPKPEAIEPPKPEPMPEPEVAAVEPKAAPSKPKLKKMKQDAPKPAAAPPPPPPEAEPPKAAPEAEEAPPVFDLGDNSFAMGNGPGASWKLKPSEGNTRFGGVAKKGQPSVRGTNVARGPKQAVGGTGTGHGTGTGSAPVPLKNLSRRPIPKDGPLSPPPYPLEAKKAGVEGPVILKVYIDKMGRVKKTQVVQAPHNLLAKAAQTAMGGVRWTSPLDKSGNPVDTVIVWKFRFVLDG